MYIKGFLDFIREQGVIGLAVGFILGGAVSKVVTALVTDIINPLIGALVGSTAGLKAATLDIGAAHILYGDLLSVLIDFIIVAAVVYFGVKMIGLEKLDKKKE
jgi:large conductance mechanosensitive channel